MFYKNRCFTRVDRRSVQKTEQASSQINNRENNVSYFVKEWSLLQSITSHKSCFEILLLCPKNAF